MLLYIHGFRSTENSLKALQLKAYFGDAIVIAKFSHEPECAVEDLEAYFSHYDIRGVIASSLGGFYATWLTEKYGLKAVLINPSTKPYETLERYLGENQTHDGEVFNWKHEHLAQLKRYKIEQPTPSRYCLYLKRGDEILDYRVAKQYYEGACLQIDEGGCHRFEDFKRYMGQAEMFLK